MATAMMSILGAAGVPGTGAAAGPAATEDGAAGQALERALSNRGESDRSGAFFGTGTGIHLGAPARTHLVAADDGRFRRMADGALPRTLVHDGTRGFETDLQGLPHPLELGNLHAEIVFMLVWSGAWLEPSSGVRVVEHPDDAEHRVRVHYRDTPFVADVLVDGSGRASTILQQSTEGLVVTTLSEHRDVDGRAVAHRIDREIVAGDVSVEDEVIVLDRVVRAPLPGDAFDAPVAPASSGATFDTDASPTVPLRFAATGHLLLDVEIDGERVGPFIFDTGAGATGIAPAAAERLGLEVVGSTPITSIFGLAAAPVRHADALTVGPATIPSPYLFEMDMSPLSEIFGVDVQGIVGFDLLQRARVTVDVEGARLTIENASLQPAREVSWQPVRFQSRTPIIEARFRGEPELFRLDAGASGPGVGAVMFNVEAAQRFRLTEAKDLDDVSFAAMHLAATRIEAIEVGGHTFEHLDVVLAREGSTVIANDPYLAGNVGVELMRPFRVMLDYPHARIAFVPRENEH